MSTSYIPEKVKNELWGRSGGRCQFKNCHKPLSEELLTKKRTNLSNIAHIIADSPEGPRGDKKLSNQLSKDIANLMLLCRDHHKLIDDKEHWRSYSVELLTNWKKEHETWVNKLFLLGPNQNTLVFGCFSNIGFDAKPLFHKSLLYSAIEKAGYYPQTNEPIIQEFTNLSIQDHKPAYWSLHEDEIKTEILNQFKINGGFKSASSVSVFALAPMPLLMLIGKLLGDTNKINIFQYHRKEQSWVWPDESVLPLNLRVIWPKEANEKVEDIGLALMISDKGDISLMSNGASDLPLIIVHCDNPSQNVIRSPSQLTEFKVFIRNVLNQISTKYPGAKIHCFPVMPISTSIEFGRLLLPKSDPELLVYDRNKESGYKKVLRLI
ncbi:SAVED domain-containing protein [Pleionea sp. CnH1-48]|uniref:SAVED domain-containing protein n=1 Tax=Pleionea sp. CnH1-48 TaxID=2954494 RepID=UPI00209770A8|nr:SAVED domain-containing protein [Pleionea sp. CnH1-48]MCO7227558.1 SAVED domain-containing protein [Pleionea sp. CnH1-48]